MKGWLTILMLLSATGVMATVDLTLFNTFPLLDNAAANLQGISTAGDLAQLILVGPNGVIDPPSISGGVGGDDALLFTTHVGAGLTTTNSGKLVQTSILYPDLFGGNSNAYVRFWDSNTAVNADYYGTSSVFTLPSGDVFGLASFDFVPLSGSPRTANIPFNATAVVPEPSNLFIVGLAVLGAWSMRRRRTSGKWFAIALLLFSLGRVAQAQGGPQLPLDVTATQAILGTNGVALPGDNPVGGVTPGCLVQILRVSGAGIPDRVVAATVIGQGIKTSIAVSGRFSTSFYVPQVHDGDQVYARVFNGPTIQTSTHFVESSQFTVNGAAVFDVSVNGVTQTTVDLLTVDSKGLTYYAEFIAGTDPNVPNDVFAVRQASSGGQVSLNGRGGRQYFLQRTLDLVNPSWSDIDGSAVLSSDANVTLNDPSPPTSSKAFYRVRVILP